ncbi:MAG: hypothetical protein HeimC3_43880 [Candidatus Heimdallarchaeota archaeon LC_3]|nr:MAG: hypothetical protein HeimC3_43880 [Candidatus Heimdallarchaeota archaeon LC_3]
MIKMKRNKTILLLLFGVGLFLSGLIHVAPINGYQDEPSCSQYEKYIVQNGNLEVFQLYNGDTLEGIFVAPSFNWTAFHNNSDFYMTSPELPWNYATTALQINMSFISNLNQTLNNQHVVVVIRNIDGYLNAFDGHCFDENPDTNPDDYICNDYVDFIVVNGWIDIPMLGGDGLNDPQIEEVEIWGLFLHSSFDFNAFNSNPHQYLLDHQSDNYNTSATIVKGGIQVSDSSLNGQHVVLVVLDHSDPNQGLFSVDGICNDPDGGDQGGDFPFDSLTYGLGIGDVLDYKISLSGFGEAVPLFDIQTDDNQELTVSDGDVISIEITALPSLDDLMKDKDGDQNQTSDNEGDDDGGLGIKGNMKVGSQTVTDSEIFGFVLPLEFVKLAHENPDNFTLFGDDQEDPTDNSTNDGDGNPFQRVIRTTDDTVTIGTNEGAEMNFEVTFNVQSGVAIRFSLSGTPPDSPTGTQASLVFELTTDLSTLNPDNPENTNSVGITTTDGFELIGIFFTLIGITIYSKKKRK